MEARQSMYYAGTAWWTIKEIMPYYLIYLGGGSLKTTWKLFHLCSTSTPQVEAFSNKVYLYLKVAYFSMIHDKAARGCLRDRVTAVSRGTGLNSKGYSTRLWQDLRVVGRFVLAKCDNKRGFNSLPMWFHDMVLIRTSSLVLRGLRVHAPKWAFRPELIRGEPRLYFESSFKFQIQICYASLARCLLKLACTRLEASMTQWRVQRVE